MANILEFIRGVLVDDQSRRLFEADPDGYVTRSGFDDLTGEDVVEAVLLLRRSLPTELAGALGHFEDESRLPRIRPSFDERSLDAAVRVLRHAAEIAGRVGPQQPEPAPEPVVTEPVVTEPPPEPEPIAVEVEPELAEAMPEPEPEPELAEAMPEPEPEPAPEPAPVIAPEPAPQPEEPVVSEAAEVGARHPAADEFFAALSAAADEHRSLLQEFVEDLVSRLSTIVERAEAEAAGIRSEAEAELARAREDAERIRAEAEEGRADLERRRAELRDAERELRERLSGLEGIFRTVLREE